MSLLYLPEFSKEAIDNFVSEGDSTLIDKELSCQFYDRIGLDRLFLILSDICANFGRCSNFSFLDVGCNNGLFADFISAYGNWVLGIDNYAIDRQQRYDRLRFANNNFARFKQIDIYDYLKQEHSSYDFVLLLSVAHQWEYGYAHTGEFSKEENKIAYIMNTLLERTSKAIYYECPMEEPGFEKNYGISFLKRYLVDYDSLSIVKISDTIASNGYVRALYRINRIFPEACWKQINYEKITRFKEKRALSGSIIRNGGVEKDNYIIYDGDTSVILPIESANPRTVTHPMGMQPVSHNKQNLWERIQKKNSENIEKIYKVYEEGFARVEIVKGTPGLILPDIPFWHKRKLIGLQHNCSLSFSLVAQLCRGLGELHCMGIAHGDPYPYNAIIGDKNAKWIDLGNVTTGDNEIRKDIHVFFLYTFSYLLQLQEKISEKMLDQLCILFEKSYEVETVMLKAADIIEDSWNDIRRMTFDDIPYLFQELGHILDICDQAEIEYQIYYQAYKYHMDSISWMRNALINKQINSFMSLAQKYSAMENQRMRISQDDLHIQLSECELRDEAIRKKLISQVTILEGQLAECEQYSQIVQQELNSKINVLEGEIQLLKQKIKLYEEVLS